MASQLPAQLLLNRTPATAIAATTPASQHHQQPSQSQQHVRVPSLPLSVHPTFTKYAQNPGTVKITIEESIFYVHRDVISFGSSFFEALLAGAWLETSSEAPESLLGGRERVDQARRWSRNDGPSVVDQPQPQTAANLAADTDTPPSTPFAILPELKLGESSQADDGATTITQATSFAEEMQELGVEVSPEDAAEEEYVGTTMADNRNKVEARVVLHDETASAFQDLLFFVYPHLEVLIHWANVSELMVMSQKFDIPLLKRQCVSFLLTSAAGKPIKAMKVAEENALIDVYREASRYLLDSWSIWEQADLNVLSQKTLYKLEKRRTWFLERLLKLGLINTARDFMCTPACSDSQTCARMLDEKWRSAWASAFRYGTPSPSGIYRTLRLLEPSVTSPALHLPHTACQNHAKAWIADLFDRMFSLDGPTTRSFVLPSTASRIPLRDPVSHKKYFLYIDYKA